MFHYFILLLFRYFPETIAHLSRRTCIYSAHSSKTSVQCNKQQFWYQLRESTQGVSTEKNQKNPKSHQHTTSPTKAPENCVLFNFWGVCGFFWRKQCTCYGVNIIDNVLNRADFCFAETEETAFKGLRKLFLDIGNLD